MSVIFTAPQKALKVWRELDIAVTISLKEDFVFMVQPGKRWFQALRQAWGFPPESGLN
jgi:hypothetical protein